MIYSFSGAIGRALIEHFISLVNFELSLAHMANIGTNFVNLAKAIS